MTNKHVNPEDFDLYALGALDGEEKLALEAHLRTCPACRIQLADARQQTALLGMSAGPITPPPALKAALMQRVRQEGKPAMNQTPVVVQSSRRSWGFRFSLTFAMITVVLACATFWLGQQFLQQRQQLKQMQTELDAAQVVAGQASAAMRSYAEVVGAPDTVSVTLQQQVGGPPGQAHVLFNSRMGLAVYSGLISSAPANKSYQLWLVPAWGDPVSGGLLAANQQDGPSVVHFQQGLAAAAFAVTLEPQGGSPQPTGQKVLVGSTSS